MVCETLGRPRSVCRLRRRRKPSGLQSAIGQQDRSPILKSSPSTRPPSSVTAPRLPLCRPLSRHSALPSGTATLSRRSASSSPGFLNIDWRSGFADSNPSWLDLIRADEPYTPARAKQQLELLTARVLEHFKDGRINKEG